MMLRRALRTFAIPVGDTPPTEFRIFRAGINTSTKGDVLFDDEAAKLVMSSYRKHGTSVMIDLEHLSLDQESKAFDPDARGWCELEVRNGELWAVNVSWTSDGSARLSDRRQRFVSPTFWTDEDGRVTEVLNIALTALPATDHAQQLIAATVRRRLRSFSMDKSAIMALLAALGLGELSEEQQAIVDAVVGGGEDPPAEEPPAEDPEAMAEGEDGEEDPEELAEDDEDKADVMAAATRLTSLTGKSTMSEAVDEVARWRKVAANVDAEKAQVAKERAVLERGERLEFTRLSVKAGMPPFMAWKDDTAKTPAKFILDMPIAELRSKIVKLRKMKAPEGPKAPAGGGASGDLSERELAMCKRRGLDPAKYLEKRSSLRRSPATAEA